MPRLALYECRVDTVLDEVRNVGVPQAVGSQVLGQTSAGPVDGESLVDFAH